MLHYIIPTDMEGPDCDGPASETDRKAFSGHLFSLLFIGHDDEDGLTETQREIARRNF